MKSKKKLFLISTKKIKKKIGYKIPFTKEVLTKHVANLK